MISEKFTTAQSTLQGDRKNNQDRVHTLQQEDRVFLVVADGLGGHPKGEVAAELLIKTCIDQFHQINKPIVSPRLFLESCIWLAHEAIVRYGREQAPMINPRTTAVLALVQDDTCYWAHVGDSRLYLIRDGKVLEQTRDHSLAELLRNYSPDQQGTYSNAITRCLGGSAEAATSTIAAPRQLLPGDTLLLCSDGFWGQLNSSRMIDCLQQSTDFSQTLQELAVEASQNGKPRSDNVTLAGLHWLPEEDLLNKPVAENNSEELGTAIDHLQDIVNKLIP